MIKWYTDEREFLAAASLLRQRLNDIEDYVEAQASVSGYCAVCERVVAFQTSAGVQMGAYTSLREGMLCDGCGGSSRSRLLFDAVTQTFGERGLASGAVLEAISPLAASLQARFPALIASEYLGDDVSPGDQRLLHGKPVRHESILSLSYADRSLDAVVHNDVLEHVYDIDRALSESGRVLRDGGYAIFVMPFFPFLENTQVRGHLLADGSIRHVEEPEYHGNGVTNEGIYTFYHYGLDFVARVRKAGFDRVEVGLAHDVFMGYLSNNYRYGEDGLVLPTVFRARMVSRL